MLSSLRQMKDVGMDILDRSSRVEKWSNVVNCSVYWNFVFGKKWGGVVRYV